MSRQPRDVAEVIVDRIIADLRDRFFARDAWLNMKPEDREHVRRIWVNRARKVLKNAGIEAGRRLG